MTLIAALPIDGIPCLIGDFLLTDPSRSAHAVLPTRPDINSGGFKTLKRRVAGTRRKIHCFNENFIAGFTGLITSGSAIFSALESRFAAAAPTIEDLTNVLSAFNACSGSTVIGWMRHSRTTCFRWSAAPGARAAVVDVAFDGSGAQHFAELSSVTSRSHSADLMGWDRSVLTGLSKIGGLLGEEMSSHTNLDSFYGFGGEMMVLASTGFQAISSVTYSFWNVTIDDASQIMYFPANVVVVYESRGRYSVLQVTQFTIVNGRTKADMAVCMMTPIHDAMDSFDVQSIGRLSFDGDYHVAVFSVFDAKTKRTARLKFANRKAHDATIRCGLRGRTATIEFDRRPVDDAIRQAFTC